MSRCKEWGRLNHESILKLVSWPMGGGIKVAFMIPIQTFMNHHDEQQGAGYPRRHG